MESKSKGRTRWINVVGSAIAVLGLLAAIFGIVASGKHGLQAWADMRVYGVVLIVAGIALLLLNRRSSTSS